MPQVTLESAYATACQKLGESTIRESILLDALNEKDAEIAQLKEKLVAAGVIEEATEIVEGADHADQGDPQGKLGEDSRTPHPPAPS